MSDVKCWRCGEKLFQADSADLEIKCRRCKAVNRIRLDKGLAVTG